MLKSYAGGRVLGETYGSEPPRVLALPGWMRTRKDFEAVLDGLDAVAVDLPGFGATEPPPEAWTTAQYAEWVSPVLEEMVRPAVVLGHSFGGRVAVHLAATHPEAVGALVLTGVPLLRDPAQVRRRPPLAYRAVRTLRRRGLLSEARMEGYRQRYGSPDYRAAQGVMREVLVKAVNEDYSGPLSRLGCAIELVWGEGDDQVPMRVAEAVVGLHPSVGLSRCPGGHFLPITAPECVRDAVMRLQARLAS